jgi:hypothetical protein
MNRLLEQKRVQKKYPTCTDFHGYIIPAFVYFNHLCRSHWIQNGNDKEIHNLEFRVKMNSQLKRLSVQSNTAKLLEKNTIKVYVLECEIVTNFLPVTNHEK